MCRARAGSGWGLCSAKSYGREKPGTVPVLSLLPPHAGLKHWLAAPLTQPSPCQSSIPSSRGPSAPVMHWTLRLYMSNKQGSHVHQVSSSWWGCGTPRMWSRLESREPGGHYRQKNGVWRFGEQESEDGCSGDITFCQSQRETCRTPRMVCVEWQGHRVCKAVGRRGCGVGLWGVRYLSQKGV